MTTAEIQAFLTVWEKKSISKAAEALYLSQSAMSTRLKTLEREIGCDLFQRGKGQRGLVPTEAGEGLYPLAVQYVALVEKMTSLGAEAGSGTLRVSSLNSVGFYLFPAVYERFLAQMPNAVLEMRELDTADAYLNLETGSADLAFTPGRRPSKKVETVPVFSENMVLVCAEDSSYPEKVSLSMLDPRNELYMDWSTEFIRWHEETFGQKAAGRFRLDLTSQLPLFLRRKDAWSIVPVSVARGIVKEGGIRRCRLEFPAPARVTNCLRTRQPSKEAASDCFLQCLRAVLAEMQDEDITVFE